MNIERGRILVSGSVVLDTIFQKEFFGGTGANIAYGLGKLKTSPLLFSLAGHNFKKKFYPHLKKNGVAMRIHVDISGLTARFCVESDNKGKEIISWQPNVYKKINKISLIKKIKTNELKKVSIAIFSPGTPESILKHMYELRYVVSDATVIFDPGQEIYNFSKKELEKCIDLTNIFIVNEKEYAQAKKILGKDPRKFIKKKIIIETRGEKGSIVFDGKKIIKVPAIRPKFVLDTTGAGDAYRVGLIFGLWKNTSLIKACNLGARLASKNIEYLGCQKY